MATYYISPSGNDTTGNGSSGNPWQTISKAVSSSTAGDTINLAAGSYTWPSALQTINDRTLVGAGASSTTVTASGGSVAGFKVYGTVSISGIRFTNAVKSTVNNSGLFYNDISTQQLAVTFNDCIFDNLTWYSTNAGAVFFVVYSVTSPSQVFTLNRCLIYATKGSAAINQDGMFWMAPGSNCTVNLNNCTIYMTKVGSINNVVIGGQNGVGGPPNATIKNCIFVESSGVNPSLVAGNAYNYTNCQNNIVYGFSSVPTTGWTGTISSDPLFVDAPNANFSLRPTSPAIDAGVLI